MTTPTQAAIEAARERLAKADEADCDGLGRSPLLAKHYRDGGYDGSYETQALAHALQEMSDAAREVDQMLHDEHWVAGIGARGTLAAFILPDPVGERAKHIAGAIDYATKEWTLVTEELKAKRLEEVLARHGLQIVPVQP